MVFKALALLQAVVLALAFAEPPSQQSQGYPASGWRPSGPVFRLPERPRSPQVSFNVPAVSRVSSQYGPPKGQNPENEPSGFESSGAEREFRASVEYNAPLFDRRQNSRLGGIENYVDLTYSAPPETLAAPPNQPAVTYGPPEQEATSTTELELTTTDVPSTTGYPEETNKEDSQANEEGPQKENLREDAEGTEQDRGVYYIYHPTGLLQKVSYFTKEDQTNMAYSAQLKYENVEPIKNPVYTYDPETFVFRKLY